MTYNIITNIYHLLRKGEKKINIPIKNISFEFGPLEEREATENQNKFVFFNFDFLDYSQDSEKFNNSIFALEEVYELSLKKTQIEGIQIWFINVNTKFNATFTVESKSRIKDLMNSLRDFVSAKKIEIEARGEKIAWIGYSKEIENWSILFL